MWLLSHEIVAIFFTSQMEVLKDELEAAKEAAQRAPSKTLKHLVERLRNQLALKEKQQKVKLKNKFREYRVRTTESRLL